MTKSSAKVSDATPIAPLTRDELRTALLGNAPKPDSVLITMFGVELELRQPNLGAILKARAEGDDATRAIDMIIQYAYVPGTNDQVFEDTDRAAMLNWPFGKDITELNNAIAKLTGIDIDVAVEELSNDPLDA